jgi:hypothetical protein
VHAFTTWGVPPVLDIAFRELARGMSTIWAAAAGGFDHCKRHRVLLSLNPKAPPAW